MRDVEGLFATALGVTQIKTIQPGRVMRVQMETDAMFEPGGTGIRAARLAMIDRLIAALSGRPRGFHFDMEFMIGIAGQGLPEGQTLAVARAGEFARELMARGVPPDALAIGVRPGDSDDH